MKDTTAKTFVLHFLMRKAVLRAFVADLKFLFFKIWLWLFASAAIALAIRCVRGGAVSRVDGYELLGAAISMFVFVSVSVARTIAAAYEEFRRTYERR